MQPIMVTHVPELVTDPSSFSRFIHCFTLHDFINAIITLVGMTLVFYMVYSFSKYGKFGREVSKENRDKNKQHNVDHELIDPVDPSSNKNKIAANRPKENAVRQQTSVSKPVTGDPSAKHSVKKDA